VPPGRLRATLRERGIAWIEDPSNADPASLRARLRARAADPDGDGPAIAAALAESVARGAARHAAETWAARWLARHADIRPEGYALLDQGPWDPLALGALLRMLAGARHPPAPDAVARLAAAPRASTLGGVRVLAAGRWRPGGWLLAREAAAMADAIAARPGAVWDGRFRLVGEALPGSLVGALGDEAARWRGDLPTAVLRTLPTLRPGHETGAGAEPSSVLHPSTNIRFVLAPAGPASCAPFAPMQPGC
jgi:tRNA(Ile)-lysidine synthase